MKKFLVSVLSFVYAVCILSAEEYHVSKTGSDLNPGTKDAPFLTISKAASVARSGDVVTVHEGIYREWVNPVNGVRGMWLDWEAIGTRVTGNVFVNNTTCDLMIEVSHGPCLVDNNVMLSPVTFLDMAQGTSYVHNIMGGKITFRTVPNRYTPYHAPHSTDIVGVQCFLGGDDRYYNNILIGGSTGLSVYDERPPFYPGIFRDMNTVNVTDRLPEPFA